MQKWWAHMADLMVVQPDNVPVTGSLRPVFHLD
jgi:L-rhamnose mutarotase